MDNIARRKEESEPESLVSDVTMDKLEVIEKAISEYYYQKDVSTEDMIDGMYQGVVAALGDPYSTYYTEEDLEDLIFRCGNVFYPFFPLPFCLLPYCHPLGSNTRLNYIPLSFISTLFAQIAPGADITSIQTYAEMQMVARRPPR